MATDVCSNHAAIVETLNPIVFGSTKRKKRNYRTSKLSHFKMFRNDNRPQRVYWLCVREPVSNSNLLEVSRNPVLRNLWSQRITLLIANVTVRTPAGRFLSPFLLTHAFPSWRTAHYLLSMFSSFASFSLYVLENYESIGSFYLKRPVYLKTASSRPQGWTITT